METVRFIRRTVGDRDYIITALIKQRVSNTIVVSVFNTLRNRGYLVRTSRSEFVLIQMPTVILEDICYEVLKTNRYVSQKPRVIYRLPYGNSVFDSHKGTLYFRLVWTIGKGIIFSADGLY